MVPPTRPVPSKDSAPWILLPCVLLTLAGVTELSAPRAARAASPPAASAPVASPAEGDGDKNELLEHWGDAKYSGEARLQMAVIAGLLAPLALLSRRKAPPRALPSDVKIEADAGAEKDRGVRE